MHGATADQGYTLGSHGTSGLLPAYNDTCDDLDSRVALDVERCTSKAGSVQTAEYGCDFVGTGVPTRLMLAFWFAKPESAVGLAPKVDALVAGRARSLRPRSTCRHRRSHLAPPLQSVKGRHTPRNATPSLGPSTLPHRPEEKRNPDLERLCSRLAPSGWVSAEPPPPRTPEPAGPADLVAQQGSGPRCKPYWRHIRHFDEMMLVHSDRPPRRPLATSFQVPAKADRRALSRPRERE